MTRDLDLQVARRVLGGTGKVFYESWDTTQDYPRIIPFGKPRSSQVALPSFSASWLHAMTVVARMRELGYEFILAMHTNGTVFAQFHCRTRAWPEPPRWQRTTGTDAICRAALAALESQP